MRLWYISYTVPIRTHLGMMLVVAERWNSETSFHLPIDMAAVTLEDVWNILKFPIHGRRVIFDIDVGWNACHRVLAMEDIVICEG